MFPAPNGSPYDPVAFRDSLKLVLSTYPQYCGHLHLPPHDPKLAARDHTRRFGRVHISWGQTDDPGVDLVVSSSSKTVSDLITAPNQRDPLHSVSWELYPDLKVLPILRQDEDEIRPCLLIKLTMLSDGGLALALAFHHCLSDTQTLCTFVQDWAALHRSLTAPSPTQPPSRPFDPLLLDSHASGNIDGSQEDPNIRSQALELPQIRLDWWAGKADGTGRAPKGAHPSIDHLDAAQGRERGNRIPWETWNTSLPVADRYLRFTRAELERIWQRASSDSTRVSRLDALLAHLWKIIVRARNLNGGDQLYLDVSIGLRTRVEPPLPNTFLGSPLINASPSMSSSALLDSPLPEVAQAVRTTVGRFNKDTVPSLLHHLAFALDPEREWNAFLGTHHLMVTSWLGTGAWDIDFGGGTPVDFGAGIGALDGLIVIMDEKPTGVGDGQGVPKRWYENGVRVRVCLIEEVMERVLADTSLRV